VKNGSFPPASIIVVSVCAVVDAAAVLTLMVGAGTVKNCGVAQLLGLLQLMAWIGFGIVPIGVALVATGAAFFVPELRRLKWWLFSAGLLALFAVGNVAVAHARYPTPTNPAWCAL